jgi:ABC-type branched-subunit amino acid transport system permease subunit
MLLGHGRGVTRAESRLKGSSSQLKAAAPRLLWLAFLLPLLLPDYQLFDATAIVLLVPIVVGYNLITGYGGQVVLASAAMVGLGAVIATVVADRGLAVPFAILSGGFAAAAVGFLLGLITVRLSGVILALTSIGLANAIALVTWTIASSTGGAGGIAFPRTAYPGLVPLPAFIGYLAALFAAATGLIICWRLVSGQWGRILRAMRASERAARTCGVDVDRAKTAVVSLGSFYWGVAGGLQAFATGFVAPSDFGLDRTLLQLAMLVVGGMGALLGPVYGVLAIAGIQTVLYFSVGLQTLIFAGLLYAVLLFMRGGVNEGVVRSGALLGAYWRRIKRADTARAQPDRPQM